MLLSMNNGAAPFANEVGRQRHDRTCEGFRLVLVLACLLGQPTVAVGSSAAQTGASAVSAASASKVLAPLVSKANSSAAVGHQALSAAFEDDARAATSADSGWEASFARGLHYSRLAVDSEPVAASWTFDGAGSNAAVPVQMLRAEVLLREACMQAQPAAKRRDKKAEWALRMYYHGKWLAERNYERSAEWRYRQASLLASEAKRSVLAAHSLSRLGYFLMHWARFDEAREVLRESERLNTKSNPLGPFLYGVLERRTANGDSKRLRAAEERILSAGIQPSEELEAQRAELIEHIHFWRAAESSPVNCLQGSDVAQVVICLAAHAASFLFG